jgi:hypothetical protein
LQKLLQKHLVTSNILQMMLPISKDHCKGLDRVSSLVRQDTLVHS